MGNRYKKYVCQNAWAEYVAQKSACSKSVWGGKHTCDTHIIHFLYTRAALAWYKKETTSLRNEKLKATELQRLKNRGKKG